MVGRAEEGKLGDGDILFQEILPRLPVKFLFRFKVVSKNWFNFLTYDPAFPVHHSKKRPNTTSFFSSDYGVFFSSDDDHFNWSKPSSMNSIRDSVRGSTNGLIYGVCSGLTQIFICNPITKHTVYAPNPTKCSAIGVACDPHNPSFGFTLVNPNLFDREMMMCGTETEGLRFRVYSSKTGEWRVWEKVSEFRVRCSFFCCRMFHAVYVGKKKKMYWSLIEHVMWFDVEKDVAGVIKCPDHGDFVSPQMNMSCTEIGECEGEVSYSRMTKQGDVEIWLLRDNDEEFEWVKRHTVGLQRIIEENWNTVFGALSHDEDMNEQRNAADVLDGVLPLPYSGGEEVWFLTENMDYDKRAFSFNLRTRELKLINKGVGIRSLLYPFMPTLLPCPT